MFARGRHRRPKSSRLNRGFVLAGTGSAALVMPAIGAASAHAAPAAHSAGAASGVAPVSAHGKQTGAKESNTTTYSVVRGDSLFKIAEKHSVDGGWEELYEENRETVGDEPSLIHPGLELTIGAKSDAGSGSSPEKSEVSSAAYSDNLDGWIKEALAVMEQHGIPGTYEGIHRNVMRESGGDPGAVNNWDSNAAAGTPSKGLLQVIAPTFESYHVPGTAQDSLDPVANIVAACNYAADMYGSIDNVWGPY